MAFSLLLSTPSDHNYNAALRLYGPPAMFQEEFKLPAKPHNAWTESNKEILHQVSYNLTRISNEEFSAVKGYRVCRHTGVEKLSWDYCLESTYIESSEENLILFCRDEEILEERGLDWISMSSFYTAIRFLSFSTMCLSSRWKPIGRMRKRIEFYHSFPFDGFEWTFPKIEG